MEEAVRGERMKTELITNISHDLKTPLTSIISYVELLKRLKLENVEAVKFIEILHDKSYRLKQLIEDLIEASKASSGTLTVIPMPMNYREICIQCLGEMEDKIETVGLEIIFIAKEQVCIYADGRHLSRIIENLISNVVKYSIPNTRVYIDIYEDNNKGIMVMKNISSTAINVDKERLTERFVRGDSARSQEGSGLGLSITQSLTEIQGGIFNIELDGDLFKAKVSMPLWKKEENEEFQSHKI